MDSGIGASEAPKRVRKYQAVWGDSLHTLLPAINIQVDRRISQQIRQGPIFFITDELKKDNSLV